MGLRGPKPKGAAYHLLRGNYRASRHGPKPGAAPPAADDPWESGALALPGRVNRKLDPLEELLVREGLPLPASSFRKP